MGEGLDLIPASGLDQMPYVETIDGRFVNATGGVTAQQGYFMRLDRLSASLTVSALKVCNGTVVAGNVDLGIYRSDGSTLTLVASTGATALSGNDAIQTINLTAAYTLLPGIDYYFALVCSSASPFDRFVSNRPGVSALGSRVFVKSSVGLTLPATQSIAAGTLFNIPYWIAGV